MSSFQTLRRYPGVVKDDMARVVRGTEDSRVIFSSPFELSFLCPPHLVTEVRGKTFQGSSGDERRAVGVVEGYPRFQHVFVPKAEYQPAFSLEFAALCSMECGGIAGECLLIDSICLLLGVTHGFEQSLPNTWVPFLVFDRHPQVPIPDEAGVRGTRQLLIGIGRVDRPQICYGFSACQFCHGLSFSRDVSALPSCPGPLSRRASAYRFSHVAASIAS